MARRFKDPDQMKVRLTEWAEQVREQASKLPPGPEREELLKKLRQADMALRFDEWATSPGLPSLHAESKGLRGGSSCERREECGVP